MQRFDTRDGNYQIEFHDGSDVLWVTFDHAALPRHPIDNRLGWGSGPLLKQGVCVISVKARHRCWFTRPDMINFFQSDWFKTKCKDKSQIILYGLSMGGFGALVYSSVIPGSVALALGPQTTLNPTEVPWENRFNDALGEDWLGPYSDFNSVQDSYGRAYIIYAPGNAKDNKHVARIAPHHRVTLLEVAGSSHIPIAALLEVGIMKKILEALSADRFSKDYFDSLAPLLANSPTEQFNRAEDSPDKAFREQAFSRARTLSAAEDLTDLEQKIAKLQLKCAIKEQDIDTAANLVVHICTNPILRDNTGLVLFALRKSLSLGKKHLAQMALDTLLSAPKINAKMRAKIDVLVDEHPNLRLD